MSRFVSSIEVLPGNAPLLLSMFVRCSQEVKSFIYVGTICVTIVTCGFDDSLTVLISGSDLRVPSNQLLSRLNPYALLGAMEWILCHLWHRFRTLNMAKNWRIEVRATAAEHWVSPRSTLGKVKWRKLSAQWRNISGLIPNTFPLVRLLNPSPAHRTSMWPGMTGLKMTPGVQWQDSWWPLVSNDRTHGDPWCPMTRLMVTPGVQWQDSWWPLVSNDRTHDDPWCLFKGHRLCAQWRNVPDLILNTFPALVRLFNPSPDDPRVLLIPRPFFCRLWFWFSRSGSISICLLDFGHFEFVFEIYFKSHWNL